VEAFRGRKLADCLAEVEARLGVPLPAEFVPEFRRRTAAAFRDELLPMPGAAELVESLAIPYCVASSGPREKIELSLSITGLLPLFIGRIVSSYEVGSWKPDPGLFLHAARIMNVAPGECAVVEDSLPGFEAGLAAGMRVFALCGRQQATPDGIIRLEGLAGLKQYLGS
jgi:HAD superfamily hydrolase (TIGR01509 family)